ncbi:MAG: serine hydrolase domain-containing protein [bacterium]
MSAPSDSGAAAPVQGRCDPGFEPLRDLFAERLAQGPDQDLGASLAVFVEGEPVLDLWGGWSDEARTRPWASDTLVNVWSTTKTMTSLAAMLLIDRGVLDPDKAVAHWWPEFAAAGKGGVTLRQVMSHASGVSGWNAPITVEQLYDQETAAARLAAQAPWWPPGSATGYHALSYGHLVGELVRRCTGQSLGRFFAQEIAAPLRADFHIGLPDADCRRVSPVVIPPPLPFDFSSLDPNSVVYKTFTGPLPDAAAANTDAWRRAGIGAAGGHGNARSVAQIQSVLSSGGRSGGMQLLRPETVDRVFELQHQGVDLVLGVPLNMGLGWALPVPEVVPYVPAGRVCFWGGWGGSMVINDADRRVTLAYMMNRMAPGIIGGPVIAQLAALAFSLPKLTSRSARPISP